MKMKFYVCLYPGLRFSVSHPLLPGLPIELIIFSIIAMGRIKNAGLTRGSEKALNFTIHSLFYDEKNVIIKKSAVARHVWRLFWNVIKFMISFRFCSFILNLPLKAMQHFPTEQKGNLFDLTSFHPLETQNNIRILKETHRNLKLKIFPLCLFKKMKKYYMTNEKINRKSIFT